MSWFEVLKSHLDLDRYKKDIMARLKDLETLMETEQPNDAQVKRAKIIIGDLNLALREISTVLEDMAEDKTVADLEDPSRKRVSSEMTGTYGEFGWKPEQEGTTGGDV